MATQRHAGGSGWAPKGTRRALGCTKRHILSSGPHQRATGGPSEAQQEKRRALGGTERPFASPSVAPFAPTPVPRGHGKANRDTLRRQEEESSGEDEQLKASPRRGPWVGTQRLISRS